MAPSACCVTVNKVLMFVAGVAALAGSIMIWVGGIGIFKIDLQQMIDDGTLSYFPNFASCQDKYNMWYGNSSSPFYYASDVLRASQVGACVAPQAPMILLASFAGLFVLGTAVAGIWAAFKYTRAAVFSSGISIGYTVALLISSLVFGLALFAPIASRVIDCRNITDPDRSTANKLGLYCITGHIASSNPRMSIQLDTVETISAFLTRIGVFFAGVVSSLLAVFVLKYLATNAYHNAGVVHRVDQEKYATNAAVGQYSAPALPLVIR